MESGYSITGRTQLRTAGALLGCLLESCEGAVGGCRPTETDKSGIPAAQRINLAHGIELGVASD